ncbi:hypothetical protein [Actinopolyspora halophila]|uniref:hypothetical protein n=1 Tax=Actinopolyspora halophila TaxID=1850 RepID=UPI000380DFC8|nr:hypothetical protein [Actinopolyspora halophila]
MARTTIGRAVNVAGSAAAVPGRVVGLIDEAERLVERVGEIVERADGLVERASGTVDAAEGIVRHSREVAAAAEEAVSAAKHISASASTVVSEAESVSTRAAETVERAERATGTVDGLLAAYEATAHRAAPMLEKFVNELSQKEVDAAIRLVDELPVLTEHVLSDILPILRTLDRVGPEIHELLEVSYDVRRAIVGIPGFGFFRRRGQQRLSGSEALDAEERPLPDEEDTTRGTARSADERRPGTEGALLTEGTGHGSEEESGR